MGFELAEEGSGFLLAVLKVHVVIILPVLDGTRVGRRKLARRRAHQLLVLILQSGKVRSMDSTSYFA